MRNSMLKIILLAFALLFVIPASAQIPIYAIPGGVIYGVSASSCITGSLCLPANTPLTFCIGVLCYQPPYLSQATPAQLTSLEIQQVIQVAEPDTTQNNVTGVSIELVNGVPTQVWSSTPFTTAQLAPAQFSAQLAKGLTITCASGATICTSAITGTYTVGSTNPPTTPANIAAQTNITDISDLITAGALPIPPITTFSYLDSTGAPHQFTSAQWAEFKVAMGIYSYQLNITYATLAAGGSASFPSNTITLN